MGSLITLFNILGNDWEIDIKVGTLLESLFLSICELDTTLKILPRIL